MTVKDLIDTLALIPQKFHDYEIIIDDHNTDEARFYVNTRFKELHIEIIKDIDTLWNR